MSWLKDPRLDSEGHLPNLIIIGAMKCGTSSLHYYLSLHPQIRMSRNKELNFFAAEFNWPKGLAWYRSHFTGAAKVYGESSPVYTHYPLFGGIPERMASVVPEAKLIYLVRDPVERLLADYVHCYAMELEHRPFTEVIAELSPHNPYIQRSLYSLQLQPYRKLFPDSQIMVIAQEELYQRRLESLQKIFRFLEVDPSFLSPHFSVIRNRTASKRRKNRLGKFLNGMPGMHLIERLPPGWQYHLQHVLYWPFSSKIERPRLAPDLQERLRACFGEDVRSLRAYTGCAFEQWRI
jgi:hypothetical protein